jgi:SAM-dependent methyltransferase
MNLKSPAQMVSALQNRLARARLAFWQQQVQRKSLASLANLETQIKYARSQDVPGLLRDIPLDLLGVLLLDVPERYPNLRAFFPAMPPEQSQDLWTGNHGIPLLAQSLAFIQSLAAGYAELTYKRLEDAHVLDFGCGWGRLVRLLYKYVPYEQIYAVDSWDKSIEACQQYGLKANLALCDTLPTTLPFNRQFDLMFAFSVFTHLGEKTAAAVLTTLRQYIPADGLLVITVRPKEYWSYHMDGKHQSEMYRLHDEKGFAFIPHRTTAGDSDAPYGDTSISMKYLRDHFPQWKVVKTSVNPIDPYQLILFLRPV